MTTTANGTRPAARTGHRGFGQLLPAEWIKFRTVRGWVIGMLIAALVTAGIALLDHSSCGSPSLRAARSPGPLPRPARAGRRGRDRQLLLRAPAAGRRRQHHRPDDLADRRPGSGRPQPWSKAGIIIKASTRPGSAYAAMMVTGGHGVRMQYDYTGDMAGPAARCPPPRRAGCG